MMEQIPENSDVVQTEVTSSSLGRTLREARERLGMSVPDVAAQIKFAPRQIEALEAEDFRHLPEPAFVRGFVRSYAKILKLDAQDLLEMLAPAKPVPAELEPAPVKTPFPGIQPSQWQNRIWLGLAALLLILAIGFALGNLGEKKAPEKAAQLETPVALPEQAAHENTEAVSSPEADTAKTKATETQPQAAPVKPVVAKPAVKAQPAASGVLRLEFDEESWVEVTDREGNILISRSYPPGSNLGLDGSAPFSVLIGHAASTRLFYKDKQVSLAPHTRPSTGVAHLTLE